jgi:signal transduction histidine kinase
MAGQTFPSGAVLRDRDERLQALKSLVGRLTHDFNNSLMPLAGFATLLGDELQPGSTGSMYVSKLGNSLRKTGEFVETVLQATYPERHFLAKPTDFTNLIQRTVELWMKALPASAQIAVEAELVPCTLSLDETLMSKALHHLLRNAEAALDKDGKVRVILRRQTVTTRQAADLGLAETRLMELVVQDTGCGMTGEVLRQAHDPFFTTRSRSSTSGLGLTLVHSVVRLHGGQIFIGSAENSGTTVRVWLPAASTRA